MIAKWIKRPCWQGADKPDRIVLTNDACFTVDDVEYWIVSGYSADGASIPKLLWYAAGTPFDPDNCEPGICHDVLYLTQAVSRPVADEVLYQLKLAHELMIGAKYWIARAKAWRMWAGVRIAGYFAYKNNAEDKTELERIKTIISQREDCAKFKTLWFSTPII